jgi:hypothetical protein
MLATSEFGAASRGVFALQRTLQDKFDAAFVSAEDVSDMNIG